MVRWYPCKRFFTRRTTLLFKRERGDVAGREPAGCTGVLTHRLRNCAEWRLLAQNGTNHTGCGCGKRIISCVQRENVGPIEMADPLQSLLDEDEMIGTLRRLPDTVGKSELWACDMLKFLEMSASVQQ